MLLVAAGLCSASLLAGTVLAQNTLLQQASELMKLDGLNSDGLQRLSRGGQETARGQQLAGHLDETLATSGGAAAR
ncbi:hypothetical protein [Teichococcus deserti]|nr:hypothetical protein [Pseudoroseomonas deserti]